MLDRKTRAQYDVRQGYCSISIPDSLHSHEVRITHADVPRTVVAADISQDIPTLTLTLPRKVKQVRIVGRRYEISLEEPQAEIRVRRTTSEEAQDELVVEGRSTDGEPVSVKSLVLFDHLRESPGLIMGHVVFDRLTTDSMLFHNTGGTPSDSLVTCSRSTLGGVPTDSKEFLDARVHTLEVTPGEVSFNRGQRVLNTGRNSLVATQH